MQILTTPEDAAAGLADYPFTSHRVPVPSGDGGTLRVHYVDEGPADARPVVFLHGNPSWSYIWRHPIAAVTEAGFRAVALDLVGMGLSDKPTELADYTVARHVAWTGAALFEQLDLRDTILVLHDWGAIIGLRLLAEHPERVAGVVVSNTGFPERDPDEPLPETIEASGPFADFQRMARKAPRWEPWTLLPMVMATPISDEVTAGYRAPYPDASLTIGSRAFTQLLPTRPNNPMLPDNFRAWKVLEKFDRPFLTLFSDKDMVAPNGWKPLVARVPGAKGQPHQILEGGGHFLQEDIPEAYSAALVSWLRGSGF
ncbi:MAG: haloalkane dehalogenase [Myxococcales bacterium]|nr:haloalkane dehalogenase [Myxococcales bacterium]MDH3843910.1 haloalkane dehalogenase [Myxococcales bacterium]